MFGQIDIYLFDQLLRDRMAPGSRILDAGCGGGRNIHYLLDAGYDVCATDSDPDAISGVLRMAADLNASLPPTNFRREPVEAMSFEGASMDVVLSIAVLHFARSDEQFEAMLESMWHVLKPGGLFFCRLASNIGMESRMVHRRGRRFLLPDGSERYLVDEILLLAWTKKLGAVLLDPLKTTIVQDQRCMTTWVLRKVL
ncbi:MAG: class I SAM-dependent methyltransferase [Vicinamibacteria bacterium]|nr:class I SAM-dependent methyltransferase [Vicinamibacteria bacterium]